MRTRVLELSLITSLAIGLGYTLASSSAIGYPAGATISSGTNPVFSEGGSMSMPYGSAASTVILTAPSDQDVIITDLLLDAGTNSTSCVEQWRVDLTLPSATVASTSVSPRFRRASSYNYAEDNNFSGSSHLTMQSGLRIPAGTSAQIEASTLQHTGCSTSRIGTLMWTASGYYAQP